MAVAFVSSSTASGEFASTFSVTKPAGAADGNWLVAFQECSLSGGSIPAAPSGWSVLNGTSYSGGFYYLICFIKQVSGDGSSYTFNSPAGGLSPVSDVRILCFSGADTPTQSSLNTGTGTTATASGITTSRSNSYVVGAYTIGTNAGETITPTSLANVLATIGTTNGRLSVAYEAQAASGASGNKDATISISKDWGAMLIVVPPPAGTAMSSTGTLMGI